MGYDITTKPSDYPEFPISVFVNGQYVDDFQDRPEDQIIISLYKDMKEEGIL